MSRGPACRRGVASPALPVSCGGPAPGCRFEPTPGDYSVAAAGIAVASHDFCRRTRPERGTAGTETGTFAPIAVDLANQEEHSGAYASTYLNFERSTEAAFNFYKSVFGTEFSGPIMRHGDVPSHAGMAPLSDEEKQLVMSVALPIMADHVLMGTDIPAAMALMGTDTKGAPGPGLVKGNDVTIVLHPDTREEADRLFAALSAGGTVGQPMHDACWDDYYGDFTDKFGTRWLINYSPRR